MIRFTPATDQRTKSVEAFAKPADYKDRLIRDYLGWDWTPEEIQEREQAMIRSLVEYHGLTTKKAEELVRGSRR